MSDLLKNASAWLAGKRHDLMTSTVVYIRGVDSVELQATVGRTAFERQDGSAVIETQARDYLIRTEDLILGGSLVLPERGDRIEETDGDQTHIYEVLPLGSEPPWRYSDPFRKTLRIHTQAIDVEAS